MPRKTSFPSLSILSKCNWGRNKEDYILRPQKDYDHEYTNILIGFALIERLDDKIVRKPVQKLLADTVSSVESYKYKINEYACQRNTKTSYISG